MQSILPLLKLRVIPQALQCDIRVRFHAPYVVHVLDFGVALRLGGIFLSLLNLALSDKAEDVEGEEKDHDGQMCGVEMGLLVHEEHFDCSLPQTEHKELVS